MRHLNHLRNVHCHRLTMGSCRAESCADAQAAAAVAAEPQEVCLFN